MKTNIFLMLITLIFVFSGITTVYSADDTSVKSIKAEVKAEACCCATQGECKDKCICEDCKGDGKCEDGCKCCCENKEDCKMKCTCDDCKDGKCAADCNCCSKDKNGKCGTAVKCDEKAVKKAGCSGRETKGCGR